MSTEVTHLSKRRRAGRRRRRILQFLVGLFIVGVAAVLWFSPLIAVTEVEVTGNHLATAAEVIQLAQVPMGKSLIAVNANQISSQVETIREVKSVEVRRVLPHKLVLAVTERTALACIQVGTQWQYVDNQGVRFGHFSSQPAGLSLIVGQTSELRAAAVKVVARLQLWLRSQLVMVSANSLEDIRLQLADGRRVLWGGSAKTMWKQKVLRPLLNISANEYDVSAPDLPTTRG